jgi:hypothetical protein
MDADDLAMARFLEDAARNELDRQYQSGELDYYDEVSGIVDGAPDLVKLNLAVLKAYWEEYGR